MSDIDDYKIKIDKGIELPDAHSTRNKYPWDEMEVGDSFLINCKDSYTYKSARTVTVAPNKSKKPKHWVSRRVDDGIRIWRDK